MTDKLSVADDWIEWNGGKCPLVRGTPFQARYRDGFEPFPSPRSVEAYSDHVWEHRPDMPEYDIIAYRLARERGL